MADGIIQIPADSTGKKLDTTELLVGANTVERERLVVSGNAATELADVKSADPSTGMFGLVTRNLGPTQLSTDLGSAYIDPRQVTLQVGTTAIVGAVAISTAGNNVSLWSSSGVNIGASSASPSSGGMGLFVRSVMGSTSTVLGSVALLGGTTANVIGTINNSSQAGGSTLLDTVNEAWRVNVVAGGAGGGVADLQVRSTAGAWVDVGWTTSNFLVPIGITTGLGSTTIIDPRAASLTASSSQTFPIQMSTAPNTAYIDARQATIVAATSGAGLGTILSTGAGGASIDPRARTWSLSTTDVVAVSGAASSGLLGTVLISTASGQAAIDPRNVTVVAGTSGLGLGTIVSTGAGGAAVDPRQSTIVAATSGAGLGTILSTGVGGAAIDPRIFSTGGGPMRVYGDVSTGGVGVNPIGIGGRVSTANPATGADGNRVFLMTDALGRLITVNSHIRSLNVSTGVTVTTTSETSILGAGGSGVFNDITHLTITNRSTANVIRVVISSSSGSGSSGYAFTIAERGGIDMAFNPPLPQTTANSNWVAACVVGASTYDVLIQAVQNTA